MTALLVATDLSPRSDAALDRGLVLAQDLNASLIVLHVIDSDLPADIALRLNEAARHAIERRILEVDAGVPFEVRIQAGRDFVAILTTAEEVDAAAVLVGTHRHGVIKDLFVGTTLERVLRHGERPVLVVPETPARPYCKVLAAVDFSPASRLALEAGIRLAPRAEMHVLHVQPPPLRRLIQPQKPGEAERDLRQAEKDLAYFLSELPGRENLDLHPVVRSGKAGEVIRSEVKAQKPDLLVLGTHGPGVARALLGGVAGRLLGDPPCDVLAVRS